MMERPHGPFHRKVLASGLFALLALARLPAAEAPEPRASSEPPRPYTRIGRPDPDTLQLEIALRRFEPVAGRKGPDIWLAAVSHIGETNYYQALQSFLDDQAVVLYEGVGDPQSYRFPDEAEPGPQGLQATLAASLGMAFQLDAIQYDRRHFQNSDMTFEAMERFLIREIRERVDDGEATPNPAFIALMGAMDGSSWLGTALHVGAQILGSSPKLKAMTRVLFIEILGGLTGDMAEIQGLPEEMQDLLQVLIRERNQVVLRDLRQSLRRHGPGDSLAVFYGAGHMSDLEKRLARELDYQPAGDRWLPAIVVQPEKAGLTDLEIKAIRSMVQWQLKALNPPAPVVPETPAPPETPKDTP